MHRLSESVGSQRVACAVTEKGVGCRCDSLFKVSIINEETVNRNRRLNIEMQNDHSNLVIGFFQIFEFMNPHSC